MQIPEKFCGHAMIGIYKTERLNRSVYLNQYFNAQRLEEKSGFHQLKKSKIFNCFRKSASMVRKSSNSILGLVS